MGHLTRLFARYRTKDSLPSLQKVFNVQTDTEQRHSSKGPRDRSDRSQMTLQKQVNIPTSENGKYQSEIR